MTLSFSINYQTQWGQHIAVLYAADADIQTASPSQLDLECHGSAEWQHNSHLATSTSISRIATW